jgi:hypothetical protein
MDNNAQGYKKVLQATFDVIKANVENLSEQYGWEDD